MKKKFFIAILICFGGILSVLGENNPIVIDWKLTDLKDIQKTEGNPMMEHSILGPILSFDGIDDALFLDRNPLAGLEQLTLEVVFRPDSDGNFAQRFLHIGAVRSKRILFEIRLNADGNWYFDAHTTQSQEERIALTLIDENKTHPADQWYTVALVIDGGKLTSYVNGEVQSSGNLDYTPMSDGITSIGVRQNLVDWFKGDIYRMRVTPRVLTSDELIQDHLYLNESLGKQAAKPLFVDPIYDGAADPVVIWNHLEEKWFMLYTNRRANVEGLDGVSWVHGTRIGIAESEDGGATWTYRDTCDINYRPDPGYTHWAPDVVFHKGLYHMYLTYVPGVFTDWKHPRNIIHLTSTDLIRWDYQSTLKLVTEKVIDASVFQMPNGTWRMYYNNEMDGKSMYYADSPDLYHRTDAGQRVIRDRGEGAKVFRWKDRYWMLIDAWDGLGVFSSDDMVHWKRQEKNILKEAGTGKDDGNKGQHCDVVVDRDRAYVFYFVHQNPRVTRLQVAELEYDNGEIKCDRNKPVFIGLKPSIDSLF